MASIPPQLTAAQRAAALAKSLEARRARSALKAEIASGDRTIFDAINSHEPAITQMRVRELLTSVPGIGATKAELLMERAKISPTRRIAGLGSHQILRLREELALTKIEPVRGSLIVISGPGGVGKSTITKALRADPRFMVSVSATTRKPRVGEVNGVDYFYYSEERFQELIDANKFLEWAEFAGARYGTPLASVEQWLSVGKNVILEIEIAGARQVRQADPDALLIFISPPSWDVLVSRLENRGTDSPERRAARLELARREMASAGEFDRIVVNHEVNQVIEEMVSLVLDFQRTGR